MIRSQIRSINDPNELRVHEEGKNCYKRIWAKEASFISIEGYAQSFHYNLLFHGAFGLPIAPKF